MRKALYFNNCFVHPTWLWRAEALKAVGPYSLEYPAAEDYEFMRRADRAARSSPTFRTI